MIFNKKRKYNFYSNNQNNRVYIYAAADEHASTALAVSVRAEKPNARTSTKFRLPIERAEKGVPAAIDGEKLAAAELKAQPTSSRWTGGYGEHR